MPINHPLLNRKIHLILEDLDQLKKYHQLPQNIYQQSIANELVVERLLEKIIGRLIDINFHILSSLENTLPKDYFTSFLDMAKHGYVQDNLAKTMAPATATRNILAHEYDEVDPRQIYEAMDKIIKNTPLYLQQIMEKIKPSLHH